MKARHSATVLGTPECRDALLGDVMRHTPAQVAALSVAAEAAEEAAAEAREKFDGRNCAYTFHAASNFSFGEGWYLAAASTLDARVRIQIEPQQSQTHQAER